MQRCIESVVLATAAFVLPWVTAVHHHAGAILLAPALLGRRPFGRAALVPTARAPAARSRRARS